MSNQTSSTGDNVTAQTSEAISEWHHSPTVVIVTSVITSIACATGLVLNCVLVTTIKCSPSLKTPPNSHLLNICFNSLLLAVLGLLSLSCLHLNGVHVPEKGSEIVSGVQLFLVMHCLLQYWGALASIGYYRYKTIHRPTLSLRVRKLIVSRSITTIWAISLLLAIIFSLISARGSAYLPSTLDPYRLSFYSRCPAETKENSPQDRIENWRQTSEQMMVVSLVMAALLLGLIVIAISYSSIFRTLRVASRAGKCRISPWPRKTPSAVSCTTISNSDTQAPSIPGAVTPPLPPGPLSSSRRGYRPEAEGRLFCVSDSNIEREEATWIVHYQKYDHSDFLHDLLNLQKSGQTRNSKSASAKRDMFAKKCPLTSTLSTGSTTSSGKTSSSKYPEFFDISLAADIARCQKEQRRSALKKQSVRRERGSLSNASKNSLVMLSAYLLCSLPLIVCQVPGSLVNLTPAQRVTMLLVCRVLFLFNSPIYPLWYLLFSIRVKKCLKRMCETFPAHFQYQ